MDTVVQKKLNQILNKETTITSVANELGVSRQTLYKWLNQYKRQRGFPIFETQQKSHKAHNKISKDIEDLVISTAKDNPNDSVSTLATKLVTTYGVQLNPTTIFRVLKRNNIRYTPAVVPVRAPTALYVPETIPVSTELPTAKLSQGVLPHVAPTQLSSVTKAATVPTSAMSSHALALPSYFLRQITALVLVGVFGVVSLYGAYQFDGNTSSFTSGEPTAPPNFEVASKVVSVFDEVNPSPLSPSTFSTLSLTDSLASLVKQGPRIAKLSLLPLETYQSFALGGYTVQAQRTPNITNANAASFLDRLSLTVFCSLSANKDASRCSYDTLLALRGTPDTTTVLGYPVEQTPVAVATSTPSTPQPSSSPRVVYVPQYITNYVTEYVLGTPGKDGKDGKDGTTTTLVNNTSIPSGFGSYSVPSVTSPSLIGATTIGYLRDATIEKATVSDSIFNGYNLFNNTAIFTGFVGVNSLAATTSVLTNATITTSTTTDAFIANLSSTNNLFTNATTTNSYISNLVASSSTLTDALLTNSTTTRAYIANLIASSSTLQDVLLTNATTTNAYIQNLVAASSSVTDALFTNATTTNLVATNATSTSLFAQALTAISSFFTNLTATNATTTNLIATNATSTNLFAGTGFVTHLTATSATSTNLFSTNALFTNLDATNINLGNATTTNFVATNATTTSLFTQNLAVGNATTQGNQTVNGDLTVNGTTTIAGNITLGTSTATYVSFNGLINSNVIPAANKMYDLGSPSFYWRDLYADNINVNTISAASTTISGTSNNTFSINSDNASTDAEDVSLIFFRGLVTPNALLRWNATTKRLESNMSFKVQNETPITGTTTLTVQAGAGQGTTNLLEVKNIGGTNLTVIDAQGRIGIGSSTPSQALTVIGNASIGGNVTATGTLTVTGTSTLATTTITQATITNASTTNLSATGATLTNLFSSVLDAVTARFTNLTATNATSTNLFSSVLTAVTGTVNTLTGGSITATSSLVSNGTLAVTGQTTLTTASSTGLTATNLYSTNAILTNATTTFFAAVNATTTNATTTRAYITALVAASSTLTDALLTRSTTTDAYITRLVAASSTLQDAIVTTLNATNFTATNATLTNASTTNLSATGATLTNLFSTLLNAVTAAFTTLTTTGTTTLATTGGNVGVGTGTPQAKLSVIGASTNNQLILGRSGDFVGNSTLYANSVMALGLINNSGAEIFNITPSGSVGIGTTTPLSKFHIEGTTDTSIQVRSTGSNDQTIQFSRSDQASNWFMGRDNTDSTFRIQYNTTNSGVQTLSNAAYFTIDDGTGNIGIGTTSPLTQLHLASATANAGGLLIESTSGTSGGIADIELRGRRDDTNGSTPFGGSLYLSRLYTPGNMVAGVNDTFSQLGNILFGGNAGGITAASIVYPASIGGIVEGTFTSSTSASTGLVFRTGSTGQAKDAVNTQFGTERMRITNAGNVGIGTSTPSSQFVIYGAGNYGQADIVSSAVNGEAGLLFKSADDTDGSGWLIGKNLNLTDDSFGIFRGGNLFTINTNGNVGIGTTTPSAKLTVSPYQSSIGTLTNGATSFIVGNSTPLGTTTGSYVYPQELQSSASNVVRLQTSLYRRVAGADWNGSAYRLQYAVDNSFTTGSKAYIEVGAGDPSVTGGGFISLGTAGSDRLVVNNTGNVGIGTTTPQGRLSVAGADENTSRLRINNEAFSGVLRGIELYQNNAGDAVLNNRRNDALGDLVFQTNDGNTKLTVKNGGNVGIGTTTPLSKLTVSGDALLYAANPIFTLASPSSSWVLQNVNGAQFRILEAGTSERFTIASGGNIGIGTTTPTAQLAVKGNGTGVALIGDSGFTNFAGISFNGTLSGTDYNFTSSASDKNLYINRPGGFETVFREANGTTNMIIKSGGNIGIGTTTPTQRLEVQQGNIRINSADQSLARLQINNTGISGREYALVSGIPNVGQTGFTLYDVTANASRMVVDAVGNVGIGTANPISPLQVNGNLTVGSGVASSSVGSIQLLAGGVSPISNRLTYGTDGTGWKFAISKNQSGVISDQFVIQDNGNIGIGTSSASSLLSLQSTNPVIQLTDSDTGTSGFLDWQAGTSLKLHAGSDRLDFIAGNAERMRITSTGNVGIGITNPGAGLEVSSSAANVPIFKLTSTESGGDGYLAQLGSYSILSQDSAGALHNSWGSHYNGATDAWVRDYTGLPLVSTKLSTNGEFMVNTDTATSGTPSFVTRFMVANSGNVGIGTTNPGTRLDIRGPDSLPVYVRSDDVGSYMRFLTSNTVSRGAFGYNADGAQFFNGALNATNMTILDGGNVGIGTTTPSQKLEVNGNVSFSANTSATGGIYIGPLGYQASILYNTNGNLDLTPRTGYNTIFTAGNVGIGTTTPGAKLQIDAGSYNANNRVLYVKNSNHAVVNTGYDTAVIQQNDAPTLRLVESGENLSTTLSSDSGISTLSSSGILRLMAGGTYNAVGYNGMGGNLGLAVAANGFVGIGTTTPSQRLSVYEPSNSYTAIGLNNASTNPDSRNWSLVSNFYNYGDFSINQSAALHGDPVLSGATSRLYVGAGGNVGIGTTNPTQGKLQVNGTIATLDSSASYLGQFYAGTGVTSIDAYSGSGQALNFRTTPSGGGATERMRITSTGNVGIGTTGPIGKLDVDEGNNTRLVVTNNGTNRLFMRSLDGSGTSDQYLDFRAYDYTFKVNGGTNAVFIKNDGNVGIGVTNPANKLDVAGGMAIGAYVANVAPTNGLVVSGRVGIGTISPGSNLEVASDSFTSAGTNNQYVPVVFDTRNNKTTFYIKRPSIHDNRNWLAHGFVTITSMGYGWGSQGNSLFADVSTYGALNADGSGGSVPFVGRIKADGPGNTVIVWLRGGATYETDGIVLDNDGSYTDIYPETYSSVAISDSAYGIEKGQYYGPTDIDRNSTNYQSQYTFGSNVGIGTTAPVARLDVFGGTTYSFPSTSGTNPVGVIARFKGGGTSGTLDFGNAGSGISWLQSTDVSDLSQNYRLLLNPNGGNVGIGTSNPSALLTLKQAANTSQLRLLQNNTDTAGYSLFASNTGYLAFSRYSSSVDVATPALTLDQSGNVGVGTTTPGTKLHVVGNSSYTGFGGGQFKIGAETGQPRWTEVGYNTSTNVGFIQAGVNGGTLSNFLINPDGGNVGIGTAPFSVSTKLSVNGDLTLAGGSTLGAGTISANQIGINVDLTLRPGATSALRLQNWNGSGWGDGIVLASSTLNVGIGTSTPGSRLDVWNATSTSNIDVFRIGTNVGSTNNIKFRIDSDGDVFTDGGTTIGTPADLAENYPALEALDAGTVVAFGSSTVAWEQADDSASSTQSYDISGVQKATNGYEAVGVVSTKAGITLGGNTTNGVPIALAGRVPVKVTSENGEVKRGDYLTVSNTMPGYAMKLTQTGRVIGRALSDSVSGRDKVMMYIENGYQQIDLSSASATTTLLTKGNLALDANGVAIINIKSLSSANGTWSIDESGRIVAKALCIDGTCLDGPGFRDLVEGNGGTPKNGAMHIIGAHAFLLSATTHTLRVLDIAAGDNPVIVASLTLPEGVTSLSANGTYLYVNNSDLSMLYIVDVTSPTQPTLLRSINTGLATEIVTPPGVPEDTPDDTATSTDEGGAEEDVPLVESEPETEPEVVEDDGEAEESPLSSLDSPETTSTP